MHYLMYDARSVSNLLLLLPIDDYQSDSLPTGLHGQASVIKQMAEMSLSCGWHMILARLSRDM